MMPRALTKRIVDQNGGVWGRVLIDLIAVAVQFRHKIRRRQDHRSPGFLSRLAARRHVTAVVEFRKGSLLKVDLWDRYWSALVARGVEYEAPIRFILSLFRREPVFFLDAGANIGYWSVLATGDEFSRWSAIAVEASPRTFEKLVENARLNGARFDCLNRALAEGSGIEVHLLTPEGKHAEARVIDEPAPRGGVDLVEAVTTISIDNLVEQTELQTSRPVILKLDVEGQEIDTLRGAPRTLSRAPLLIYEDHGSDDRCEVSEYIVKRLGYEIFYCTDDFGVLRMPHVDAVRDVKKRKSVGYNFAACASSSHFYATLDGLALE